MSGYPVQYAKVQPPPLREETLARHRLLDWLALKIHHRVILVLADAGYGKTTLLADFANRTRTRTLWYRLDEDDRDWISLLNHLVAAGREADASFAPNTAALLADTSLSGPTRDTVIDVFIRELQAIAPQGAILIFDDFHLVDDAPDAQLIAREIVNHAPERLTVVFASRRQPGIPMARLRATGEVAELTTDDLRFDADETERLFRDTYHRTLDADVLADVASRTEGWAASLQLVHAALRDRTPTEIRRFVRSLSGGDHELYDYLAEEVVGDLPGEMQDFLMRTSILQVVTPAFAEVVTGLDAASVSRLTASAERVTLLGRRARGPRTELRYHPLVREFLEARLTRDFGAETVRELHRAVAAYAESRDWRVAAHHLWSAGDRSRAFEVIDQSAKSIIGRGEYLVAAPFVEDLDPESTRATFEVVLSRRDFKDGHVRKALTRALRAAELDPASDVALANLSSQYMNNGRYEDAMAAATRLLKQTDDDGLKGIAAGLLTIVESTVDGDLAIAIDQLEDLAQKQHRSGDTHFEAITYLNLADFHRATGHTQSSIEASRMALDLLLASSAGSEVASARAALAWNLAHAGDLEAARAEIDIALLEITGSSRFDVLSEAADIECAYGSIDRATDHLTDLRAHDDSGSSIVDILDASLLLRRGRAHDAVRITSAIDVSRPSTVAANKARALTVTAHALVSASSGDAPAAIERAALQARTQSARLMLDYCEAVRAAAGTSEELAGYLRRSGRSGTWTLSRVAELISSRLQDFESDVASVVEAEAVRRPERWRTALRMTVDAHGTASIAAARLLEEIGESEDVARLRRVAHVRRGGPEADLGRGLARRLAPRVLIEDLGRVTIRSGSRTIEGSSIRRKVLALICYLMTRPRFSATRDEVMDALWPDFDPADALNSLNQTVYFLRRVFEPGYKDDLSPGYVRHESDVIWLDSELVQSRSQHCLLQIHAMPADPAPAEVARLADEYVAPFALDFAYEEWANDFRSSLHSSYLQIVERAVNDDTSSGHFERGIELARRALDLSPEADQIELSLLRLYRLNGSHAAAAEQYSHYAANLRDNLGIEPPALESL